jgi:hypothetical protein
VNVFFVARIFFASCSSPTTALPHRRHQAPPLFF